MLLAIVQFAVGLLAGIGIPATILWLCFVYPYAGVSLKAFWIGGAVGLSVALIVIGYYVVLIAIMWGAD